MVFWRKSKSDPIAEMTAQWQTAEALVDPADKLLSLKSLKNNIIDAVSAAGGDVARFEKSNMSMTKFGIWAPLAAGAVASVLTVNPIPFLYGLGMAVPGGAIGAAVDKGAQVSSRALNNKKLKPRLEALQDLHARVAGAELAILKESMEKLESSPRALEVLQAYPSLQTTFAAVAARRASDQAAAKKADKILPVRRPAPKGPDGKPPSGLR